ncbi:MAG TPA: N-acetyltransferase [Chondromyces sp.]|nr:N-acetyltransferase [Chondromyces sp.]
MAVKVENLKMNFKTMEEFKQFREYGLQELSLLEELQYTMVEDHTSSPFYGIYFGNKLVARMCLYVRKDSFHLLSENEEEYLEIWKLEVLPNHQHKGYGRMLVDFAKGFKLPIMTKPKVKSHDFWRKMGFEIVSEDSTRLVWDPSKSIEKIS